MLTRAREFMGATGQEASKWDYLQELDRWPIHISPVNTLGIHAY